jgi:alpha-L-fucosidase
MTDTGREPATHGDVFGSEYHSTSSLTHPWEECRGISQSFAYNYEDNEQSLGPTDKLLHMFIDIVSKNGNLNLIIGPDSARVIPEPVVRRLKQVGSWLKVNGEAIYGTRILPPYHEGNVSYTRSKDGRYAYAICKEWPGRKLTLQGVRAEERAEVTMLGVTKPLVWQQTEQELTITIPDNLQDEKARPCQYARAIRIPMQTKITRGGGGAVVISAWCLLQDVNELSTWAQEPINGE